VDLKTLARRGAVAGAIATVVLVALVLELGGADTVLRVDDLSEMSAAALAALACFGRAWVSSGRMRARWVLFGCSAGAWSTGQAVWSYYELVAGRDTPFPSWADLGFLLFPALAVPAVLLEYLHAAWLRRRARILLDATMVVVSLVLISWPTALGATFHQNTDGPTALVVGLAYPCTDVLMLTTIVLLIGRAKVCASVVLNCAGLALMAVADSAFAYLTASGNYQTGAATDLAWVGAFLAIGLSALFARPERQVSHDRTQVDSQVSIVIPYLVVVAGCLAELLAVVQGTANVFTFACFGIVACAAFFRQLLTLLDNRELTADVIRQRAELEHLAFHDPLTGLANRALFLNRVDHALELRQRDRRPISLIFIDLDDFKTVNDTYGHDVGDGLLTGVAERLSTATRRGSTLARLGGDEFAVLLEDGTDSELVGRRLLQALSAPIAVDGHSLTATASVGAAAVQAGEDVVDTAELVKRADVAMYSAKRTGKGRFVGYSQPQHGRQRAENRMRQALLADISAGRLQVAYQPIVRLSDGKLYGREALARWSFLGRAVSPLVFVRLAEEGGGLGELDLEILRRGLADPGSARGVRLSANTSLGRLATAGAIDRLAEVVGSGPLIPREIVLEISEQDSTSVDASLPVVARLRELGVRIAVDDFGVGYSNFDRLTAIAPDVVKIDRRFVASLGQPGASALGIRSMIKLAHDLGAEVIGEGVETELQRDILGDLGCDAVQGFLYGEPVVAAAEAELAVTGA
jgi:diguanylate cyclase (GGDEF)-like protein